MSRPEIPELPGGLPKNILTGVDDKNKLLTVYGQLSLSILIELKDSYPSLPADILTVGDNWMQMVESRTWPINDLEREMQKNAGATVFGDMWPIMERKQADSAMHLLSDVMEGVRVGSLDDRIRDSIAILDRTSVAYPLFSTEHVVTQEETPWGRILRIQEAPMQIFHIRKGFTRKIFEQLGGGPEDDVGWSFVKNE